MEKELPATMVMTMRQLALEFAINLPQNNTAEDLIAKASVIEEWLLRDEKKI